MLTRLIVYLVEICCRFAWLTVLGFLALCGLSAEYARTHFALSTDSSQLISTRPAWRQRELAIDKAFPERTDLIVVVIDAASPERAEEAAAALAGALKAHSELFQFVQRPDASPLFARNGLLFLSREEVAEQTEALIRAQPFLGSIAADPTLRGLARTLSFIAQAVSAGQAELQDFTRQLQLLGEAFDAILKGEQPKLSWAEVMTGRVATQRELRRFLHVKPVLDFGALEPGARATAAIRAAAAKLNIDPAHGARVRLTGPVPMADEEFATITEGAALNTALTVLSVLL